MYKKTRAEGFGAEVKRRILIGTYVLSHGYYDAYYLQAQKLRRLIAQDFAEAFEKCDVIMGPTAPDDRVRARREEPPTRCRCTSHDIYTIAVNLAGLPGHVDSVRLRRARACRSGCRSSATISTRRRC